MTNNSSTIESLLEAKFKPRRTIVLAFGFDEESSGFEVGFLAHIQCPELFFQSAMPDRVPVLLDQHWKAHTVKTASQWSWMKDVR